MILRDDRYHSLLVIAIRLRKLTIRCLLLYFSNTAALPFPMVAPVPAQIAKPRFPLHSAARRRPQLTTHTHYPLSFRFRHLHHVASISLPFSAASAYFPSPRGCAIHHSRRQTLRPPGMPSLLFASTCCLFVVSLPSFLHSLPLFSIVWSLFPQNTRVGVPQHALMRLRILPVTTWAYPLRPLCSELRALCVALFPSFYNRPPERSSQ